MNTMKRRFGIPHFFRLDLFPRHLLCPKHALSHETSLLLHGGATHCSRHLRRGDDATTDVSQLSCCRRGRRCVPSRDKADDNARSWCWWRCLDEQEESVYFFSSTRRTRRRGDRNASIRTIGWSHHACWWEWLGAEAATTYLIHKHTTRTRFHRRALKSAAT